MERFNREIGRRTDVVGIFPDDKSLIRLVSMLAIEANDEWLVGKCYMSLQSMEPLAGDGVLVHHSQERQFLSRIVGAERRLLADNAPSSASANSGTS